MFMDAEGHYVYVVVIDSFHLERERKRGENREVKTAE